ncbi:baculoviral IAP repeat-containing protein 8-like isoform X1 [Styela clava]
MPQTVMPKYKTSSDGLMMSEFPKIKQTATRIGDPNDATYRLASFSSYLNVPIQPKILAKAGFYYTGQDDITRCFRCGSRVRNWEKDDNPCDSKYHEQDCTINRQRPTDMPTAEQQSVSATRTLSSNSGQTNTLNAMESNAHEFSSGAGATNQEQLFETFNLDHPINPHMRNEDVRMSTFRDRGNWQVRRIHATPEQLAKAGFFYLGEEDKVKCFYCNGGLCDWEYNDDPWIEHAKWYPHCEFTLHHKGPAFITDVTSQFPNLNRSTTTSYDIPPPGAHVVYQNYGSWIPPRRNGFSRSRGAEIMDPREEDKKREVLIESALGSSELIKQARDMGFTNEKLRRALQKQYQVKERNFCNIDEVLVTIGNLEDEEHVSTRTNHPSTNQNSTNTTLMPSNPEDRENRLKQLEEEKKCKICLDEEANVVFVPCGHLSTCVSCAQRVSNCPICRSYVRQKIKTYIS